MNSRTLVTIIATAMIASASTVAFSQLTDASSAAGSSEPSQLLVARASDLQRSAQSIKATLAAVAARATTDHALIVSIHRRLAAVCMQVMVTLTTNNGQAWKGPCQHGYYASFFNPDRLY